MFEGLLEKSLEFFIAYGAQGLFVWSFIESIIFPIPTDVLLIGLALQSPPSAIWLALVTSIGSVCGAAFGYLLGYKAGRPLLIRLVSPELIEKIEVLFGRYEGWAIGIAGFTPIPYKVFTIGAGVFHINFKIFMIASIISRSARFMAEGILLYFFGETAWYFITNYFELATVLVILLIILVYFIFKKLNFFKNIGKSKD